MHCSSTNKISAIPLPAPDAGADVQGRVAFLSAKMNIINIIILLILVVSRTGAKKKEIQVFTVIYSTVKKLQLQLQIYTNFTINQQ